MREPPPSTERLGSVTLEARGLLNWVTVAVRDTSLARTITRWHSHHAHHDIHLASGPLAHHPAAAHFPAGILPHPVRVRLQDQLRRGRPARPAVHRRHLLHARSPSAAGGELRQLPLSADR